jgi:hypothetical protein
VIALVAVAAGFASGHPRCTLASARAAIRTTKPRVPSLAGGTAPADPASADNVVCFGGAMAVSIASGGTAGDVAWIGFAPAGGGWRPVKAVGGYKLGLFVYRDQLEVVLPVYKRSDPNCCPTGGFDRAYYKLVGKRVVVTELRHTKTFIRP